MKAASVGNVDQVQYLVEHGAKIDLLNSVGHLILCANI